MARSGFGRGVRRRFCLMLMWMMCGLGGGRRCRYVYIFYILRLNVAVLCVVQQNTETNLMQDLDIRRSEDAGRYLCDFIYYSSLAHLWKKNEERRVVFFHVPVVSDEAAIQTGKDALIELIRAVVQSGRVKKVLNIQS